MADYADANPPYGLYYFPREAAGATGTRLPCALYLSRGIDLHNSGAIRVARWRMLVYVIARSESDEAIQLSNLRRQSWIASLAPAMTVAVTGCLKF